MPAYSIIGPSGSGKTTVGEELRERGYRVIDTDFEQGLSSWFNTKTGLRPTSMPEQPYPRGWLANHKWGWDVAIMNKLLDFAEENAVFFCGGASNYADFSSRFDMIFGLHVDNEKVKSRLQSREPQRWTDESVELERMLVRNQQFLKDCEDSDIVLVDSLPSPKHIADTIVGLIK
jgi:shikimate kinase